MSLYLERVKIANFRTFGEFALELPGSPGALIITGPNGLGKSSFFDAIEWALTSDVKRLSPHVRRETEAVYLTRDGAEPFSHAVRLDFTSGEVDRHGHAQGSWGTPLEEIKALLVSETWPEQVKDLATYLALTHFLGQGADQRFMARQPHDQWQTLRTPSGVERLETIRKRLRGRSATIAMNRRAEAAAADLRVHEDGLAVWDSRVQRLRRLEGVAAAAGALPRDEIQQAASSIRKRVAALIGAAAVAGPPDLPENLVQLAEVLAHASRESEARGSRLSDLARLPEQYAEIEARLAAETAQLVELQAQKRQNQEATQERAATVEHLDRDRRQRLGRAQRVRERLNMLLAADSDLRDAAQADERARAVRQQIEETDSALAHHRATAAQAARELAVWQAAREAVAAAEERLAIAQTVATQASGLRELERRVADAEVGRAAAAAAAAGVDEIGLRAEEARAAEQVEARQTELEELRERAGALSAALASLAAHLTEHDSSCPVCRTGFAPGKLKRLADLSARQTDENLPVAQQRLDEAIRERQAAQAAVAAGRRKREALIVAENALTAARQRLEAAREALAARLNMEAASDLRAAAQVRLNLEAQTLDAARRALAPIEASATEQQRRRVQAREQLDRLEARLRDQRAGLASAEADRTAADGRFQVRLGAEGVERPILPDLIAQIEADLAEAESAQATAEAVFEFETAALAALREEGGIIAGRLGERERLRVDYQEQLDTLRALWLGQDLEAPPSHSGFEAALGKVRELRAALRLLEEERKHLADALEATAGREETENLRRSLEIESGDASFEDHRAGLAAKVAAAQARARRISQAQSAINLLAERLKNEADAYSSDVLRPLNDLISAFNDALLTNPGMSVAFNTEYFADRTEFNTQLQQRTMAGTAPIWREINPRLILSEGQLAANGFSILCSASISYSWSSWRALLLDDPLQHNDVIHAAAFTDLMRNLVELRGYQVLMSSHDRAETEFIERKFSAACVPCTVVQLIADSPRGVTFEVRNNAPARDALRERELQAG
jgi:DNA repair exonuclease SbcCD ATPase subunit